MMIESRGTVFCGRAGSTVSSATFPLPCVSRGGRWLCTFRAAPAKAATVGQHVLLTWSDDQGATWQPPVAPFAPPPLEGRPGNFRLGGLTQLRDGHLLATLNWVDQSDPTASYFNEETEGLLDTRVFLSTSADEGETWSEPRVIDTPPFDMPTPLTGPILQMPDGELACQIELNKHYHDRAPWRHASVILFSTDGGKTWPRHSVVTQDPRNQVFYWDQRLSLLPDGKLFDVFWTFDRSSARYLNIHCRFSVDHGRHWSTLRDTGVAGQPGPVFPLAGGNLAMPLVDRSGAPRIVVRSSRDDGATWPDEPVLVVYDSVGSSQTAAKATMQDAWAEMVAFSVGLPNVASLPAGGALLVYYAGAETDVTELHWAKVV